MAVVRRPSPVARRPSPVAMFRGRFAAGLFASRAEPRLALGTAFLASQLPGAIWPWCLLAGVESVAVVGQPRLRALGLGGAPGPVLVLSCSYTNKFFAAWEECPQMIHFGRRFDPTPHALVLGLVLVAMGCAGKNVQPAPVDPPEGVRSPASPASPEPTASPSTEELVRLRAALNNAERSETSLRDALAERDSEVTALEEAKASLELELQSAIEELMRSQASVRNVQSRAFAVSRIAEVRVEVKTFRSRKDPALTDRLDRAEAFLDRADRALQEDNMGAAAYLAERASELLRQVRTVAEIRANEPKELLPIVPPRQIEVGSLANLRKAPTSDSERIGSVEPGTKLIAVARQGEWYQVEIDGGGSAWIHRRLIR